jgi:hypothetical protein
LKAFIVEGPETGLLEGLTRIRPQTGLQAGLHCIRAVDRAVYRPNTVLIFKCNTELD